MKKGWLRTAALQESQSEFIRYSDSCSAHSGITYERIEPEGKLLFFLLALFAFCLQLEFILEKKSSERSVPNGF